MIAGTHGSPQAGATANLSDLTPPERQAWQNAVDYYAKNFADSDIPYNSFLVQTDDRLSAMSSCPDLTGRSSPSCAAGIDPTLTGILEDAAPVYRAHWWNEQDHVNQVWIAQATGFIRQYGGKPAEGLAGVFNNNWPADPIPIDVVFYAGTFGAYTTLAPLHIVVSSANHLNQGFAALETVFREASHSLAEPIRQAIIQQCRLQTKPIPRDLWHALASYTTATIFDQSFPGRTLPTGASPKALSESNREYVAMRGWQGYQPLLDRYWLPYLNGQTGLESAIIRLVNAL